MMAEKTAAVISYCSWYVRWTISTSFSLKLSAIAVAIQNCCWRTQVALISQNVDKHKMNTEHEEDDVHVKL